jgi:hypothetical protein
VYRVDFRGGPGQVNPNFFCIFIAFKNAQFPSNKKKLGVPIEVANATFNTLCTCMTEKGKEV